MKITILNENDNEKNQKNYGILENKERKIIFILTSDWIEQIDTKIKNCNQLQISEIIIKPRFSPLYQLITIDINFNFFLPVYNFTFSHERSIQVLRENKSIDKNEFNRILNEFLIEIMFRKETEAKSLLKGIEDALK